MQKLVFLFMWFWLSVATAAGSLPSELSLGAATIHRYEEPQVSSPQISITVWVPTPNSQWRGTLANFNRSLLPAQLPERFVIGDGGTQRAFTGINLSPQSPLTRALNELEKSVWRNTDGQKERILEYLRVQINRWIQWTPHAHLNNGEAELEWDRKIVLTRDLKSSFLQAGNLPLFHFPVDSGQKFPVVGLERYLEVGQGYCIQKALLASLLLSRFGVPHRLVNGAVVQSPGISGGHTWIQLADGRIFDPSWELLAWSGHGHPIHDDWLYFGGSWRFENQNYLILSFDSN